MQVEGLAVVILAAGKGTRMQSDLAKVLHPLAGKELLAHVLETVNALGPDRTIVVVGHQANRVRELFSHAGCDFVDQTEQLGTGHAVQQAQKRLEDYSGEILVLCGDMPLITAQTLKDLVSQHRSRRASCTVLVLKTPQAKDFGRIVRDAEGKVARIVEHRDASDQEKTIDEYNAGVYCFDKGILFKALDSLRPDNEQNELYLTDTIEFCVDHQYPVEAVVTRDADEIFGINTVEDLRRAEQLYQARTSD